MPCRGVDRENGHLKCGMNIITWLYTKWEASQLAVARTEKGSSVPTRNGLITLTTFRPECTDLIQGEDCNWSRTHSYYGYT